MERKEFVIPNITVIEINKEDIISTSGLSGGIKASGNLSSFYNGDGSTFK